MKRRELFASRSPRRLPGPAATTCSVWRGHAETVSGHGIASGHFLPEEGPAETYRALRGFFAKGAVLNLTS